MPKNSLLKFMGLVGGQKRRAIRCKSSPHLLRNGGSVGFPLLSLPEGASKGFGALQSGIACYSVEAEGITMKNENKSSLAERHVLQKMEGFVAPLGYQIFQNLSYFLE